ncbi:Endoribonuclease Dicer-like protein 3 [Forsythia ovata]|uniref:Endoribonuclease Dicer-like protein 3 n=1 Tax=Forsythia ovata TaxID=205694 RepID=A0ABD1W4X1_9LAMI
MDFSCSIAEVHYSSFLLLIESKLDDDVGNNQVELFLLKKFVRSFVSFHGQIYLDAQQVAKAKSFQELLFNGLFGKLFFKLSGKRRFLLETEESLWDPLNMYLLLPLESVDKPSREPLKINWTGIESCVSVVEFLKKNAWLKIRQHKVDGNNSPILSNDSVATKFNSHVIQLANKSASVDSLKEMVVVAIHTGRIYSILHAVDNTSAESAFEAEDTIFSSYADYFHKKYGFVLKHPEQPLLLLKQSHNSHNLLVDFSNEGGNKSKNKWTTGVEQHHAHMPPELLVGTDIRTDILKSFYLLPSIMHRLESLMLASQLRKEIAGPAGNLHISSSLILEALTTLRCNESFSMERLELLGDSVLKYTVSCHLFLKYPKFHEGQLSSHRSRAVCNATLHKLGTNHTLQEYIRDCAFDPRQWTAPGQRSIWCSPCDHGLDTREVPVDNKFVTEDEKLVVGKTCDKGHRWMGSKTVSDCVEALIGAYYVGGGLTAALQLMKWLSIGAEVEPSWVDNAIKAASLHSYTPKAKDIKILESKIGYEFSVKGLLLEAITHEHEQGVDYCYQRLEFLGDSLLDILVTWHLYQSHPDVDPGELTDLRAASVSNDNFAIAAVKQNLYPHLQYGFSNLGSQISEFVKSTSDLSKTSILTQAIKAPKVLGDLVESIAGAMLIDTNLDLHKVWKVFKPLLSPIVTPDNLELPPCRELIELCDSLGYFIKVNYTLKGNTVHAELKVQLEDVMLLGHGSGHDRKAAKGMAAVNLLKQLEARGIVSSKRRKQGTDDVDDSSRGLDGSVVSQTHDKTSEPPRKKLKLVTPVMQPINMNKGGPRSALFDLCKRLQWPLPTFQTFEEKSKTPIKIGDKKGFNKFESRIKLIIPDFGVIELTGEARADKKASFDSAALLMLYELERQEKVVISEE